MTVGRTPTLVSSLTRERHLPAGGSTTRTRCRAAKKHTITRLGRLPGRWLRIVERSARRSIRDRPAIVATGEQEPGVGLGEHRPSGVDARCPAVFVQRAAVLADRFALRDFVTRTRVLQLEGA